MGKTIILYLQNAHLRWYDIFFLLFVSQVIVIYFSSVSEVLKMFIFLVGSENVTYKNKIYFSFSAEIMEFKKKF